MQKGLSALQSLPKKGFRAFRVDFLVKLGLTPLNRLSFNPQPKYRKPNQESYVIIRTCKNLDCLSPRKKPI